MGVPGTGRVNLALERFDAVVGNHAMLRLDDAWLAMTAVLVPALDGDRWRSELDALAASCPSPTRAAIVDHLFGTGRFRGERERYGDWRNSRIDHVLSAGSGIPITLTVTAIEVGRRLGVPLVGVGMPAHFLLGDATDGNWFADAFAGGTALDRDGCRDLFARVTGGRSAWRDAYLRPTPSPAIVARMLNNLGAAFSRDRDRIRLGLVLRMRSSLGAPPAADELRRSQAVFN